MRGVWSRESCVCYIRILLLYFVEDINLWAEALTNGLPLPLFRVHLPTPKCFCRKSQKCLSCGNSPRRAGGRASCKSAGPRAPEFHQFLSEAVGHWAQVSPCKATCDTGNWASDTTLSLVHEIIKPPVLVMVFVITRCLYVVPVTGLTLATLAHLWFHLAMTLAGRSCAWHFVERN